MMLFGDRQRNLLGRAVPRLAPVILGRMWAQRVTRVAIEVDDWCYTCV